MASDYGIALQGSNVTEEDYGIALKVSTLTQEVYGTELKVSKGKKGKMGSLFFTLLVGRGLWEWVWGLVPEIRCTRERRGSVLVVIGRL